MNERILELISETDEWLENNAQSDRWEREIKFAELIVRECAGKVDWILAEGGKTQGDLIREHFYGEEL
jgi:hypothetical protein